MLLVHWMRAAASRTFCTAGTSMPTRMAMMAITTKSSISVNARLLLDTGRMFGIERSPLATGRRKEGLETTYRLSGIPAAAPALVGGNVGTGTGPVGQQTPRVGGTLRPSIPAGEVVWQPALLAALPSPDGERQARV